ncbi:MAG: hypothetical protein Q9220_007830 [cf. Caloplaca sp. 1 TL-2023]
MPSKLLVRARELYVPTMSGSNLTQLGALVDAFIAAETSIDKALTDFDHQAMTSGADILGLKSPKARLLMNTVSSFISSQALAVPRIQESLESILEVPARGHAVRSFNEVYGGLPDHRGDWWFPWYHFRDLRREQQQQDLERYIMQLANYHRTQKGRLQTVSLEFEELQEELTKRKSSGWRDNRIEEELCVPEASMNPFPRQQPTPSRSMNQCCDAVVSRFRFRKTEDFVNEIMQEVVVRILHILGDAVKYRLGDLKPMFWLLEYGAPFELVQDLRLHVHKAVLLSDDVCITKLLHQRYVVCNGLQTRFGQKSL